MSLTERQKEIALECWHEIARHGKGMSPEMFADLFLSRVREEQEAKAYIAIVHHRDGRNDEALFFTQEKADKWISHGKDISETIPLFTTPPAAPCDCDELVRALRIIAEDRLCLPHCRVAANALANHAKRTKAGEE